eukprot:1648260-Amphidinium_carterae.4
MGQIYRCLQNLVPDLLQVTTYVEILDNFRISLLTLCDLQAPILVLMQPGTSFLQSVTLESQFPPPTCLVWPRCICHPIRNFQDGWQLANGHSTCHHSWVPQPIPSGEKLTQG